ncbi:unnamed protein product [Prunus armeniaca]|uniref:Uncharacterized protein n=1 Tax=Prunus armeniaca TaxID=36596 RepID=A0A6J5VFP4_PRUAR|nr:unnamed protein product [Prunus armeniaca]
MNLVYKLAAGMRFFVYWCLLSPPLCHRPPLLVFTDAFSAILTWRRVRRGEAWKARRSAAVCKPKREEEDDLA